MLVSDLLFTLIFILFFFFSFIALLFIFYRKRKWILLGLLVPAYGILILSTGNLLFPFVYRVIDCKTYTKGVLIFPYYENDFLIFNGGGSYFINDTSDDILIAPILYESISKSIHEDVKQDALISKAHSILKLDAPEIRFMLTEPPKFIRLTPIKNSETLYTSKCIDD